MKITRHLPAAVLAALISPFALYSQTPVPSTSPIIDSNFAIKPSQSPSPTPKENFFKEVVRDQGKVFSSPARIHRSDLEYLVPFAMINAALIPTDETTSRWVSRNGSLPEVSRWVSYGGTIYATGGVAAGFYLFGRSAHNDRARETGRLSAEALIDTAIVTEVLKYAMGRKRPDFGTGEGHFFDHGNSFPSGHSSSAWAVATVVSYEYRNRPLIRYGAFAVAAAISMSRYTGRNHFLSDIAV
jgi:hypothetical protein